MVDDVVALVAELFARSGGQLYFGEPVTQRTHALQCAWFATQDGAGGALVVAALLHDVGHLIQSEGEDAANRGVDTMHEEIGYRWLTRFFGKGVTEPVRLHVAAKRYLCAIDPHYAAALSPASRQSLEMQGGAMSPDELSRFADRAFRTGGHSTPPLGPAGEDA